MATKDDPLALTNINDPAVMEYLLAEGGLNQEAADAQRQQQMAAALRGRSATPEGRQAGKLYVAANPLEHIGSALGQGMANYREKNAIGQLEGISGQRKKLAETLGTSMKSKAAAKLGIPGSEGFRGPMLPQTEDDLYGYGP